MTYATVAEASREAAKLRRWYQGGTWAAYRCKFCGGWHVGRQSADRRRAMYARRAALAE